MVEGFCKGSFRPQNESDIRCYLYSTLLQTKSQIKGLTHSHLVLSEFPLPKSQEKIDLAIVRWKKMEDDFQPRLVEIKETSQAHLPADEVEKRIKNDIDKLRRCREMFEEEEKITVLKYYKTPVILFFFRGAGKQGIAVKTDLGLKKIQKNYDDIIL